MLLDTTVRVTGDVYKYKAGKPLDVLTYEIQEAKLSIFFAVSTFVLQISFVYLCWTFGGSKYRLKHTEKGYQLDQTVINEQSHSLIQDESIEVSASVLTVDEIFYEERGSYNYDKMFSHCDDLVLQFVKEIDEE